jgi:uncharacterized membrane protein
MSTKQQSLEHDNRINVGDAERWLSVVAGAAFAAYGLRRRSGAALAAGLGLGAAFLWRGTSGNCPVYQSLGVSTAGEHQGDQVSVPYGRGKRVDAAATIDTTPDQMYTFWRNFENLPRFMHNLESVTVHDSKRSRWVSRGPAGSKVEWEAEIINEIPGQLIGWRSVDGSTVENAGSVHFTPATGGRGTVVRVELRYDPPGGKFGAAVSKLFGENPERQVREDLRRLKMLIETGEIATNDGQPSGRKG